MDDSAQQLCERNLLKPSKIRFLENILWLLKYIKRKKIQKKDEVEKQPQA